MPRRAMNRPSEEKIEARAREVRAARVQEKVRAEEGPSLLSDEDRAAIRAEVATWPDWTEAQLAELARIVDDGERLYRHSAEYRDDREEAVRQLQAERRAVPVRDRLDRYARAEEDPS